MLRELDVVKVVKSIRNIRMMKSIQFSPLQKILFNFQYQRIIVSDDSESAEEQHNFVKLMRHSKVGIKLLAISKLHNSFKCDEPIDKKTRILIDGVYRLHSHRIKEEDQEESEMLNKFKIATGLTKKKFASMSEKMKMRLRNIITSKSIEEQYDLPETCFHEDYKAFFSQLEQSKLSNFLVNEKARDCELQGLYMKDMFGSEEEKK